MALPPDAPHVSAAPSSRIFGRARFLILVSLFVLLVACLVLAWTTRDAMANLPFLQGKSRGLASTGNQKTLVDLRPWQTAQALAALAVTAEETEFAHDAERLADHEVDQAFAAALRQATAQTQNRVLSGEALARSQRVAQLQQLVAQDQALVDSMAPKSGAPAGSTKPPAQPVASSDDLDIAKAQLGLDSDELADAQQDLERASGDNRSQIQSELTAHEASMAKFDSASQGDGQVAVVSARRHGTLASRFKAWFDQRDRAQLIQQAMQQAQADVASLTSEHNNLEAKANASAVTLSTGQPGNASRLAGIKDQRGQRQLLSIYDDRIQTDQQLATVYGKWYAQVLLQHRIVFHLMLQSLAWIVLILISMILFDALVRQLLANPSLDWKRMQTLRTVLELGIQVIGVLLILFVLFGPPQQLSTVLGLATAGLTIALQDFILAFLGWFVLMGKNGIRIGDWVEINGVGGEVTEIGLIYTTLLETGDLKSRGQPTGRRITFINGYSIKGQYFNFSTTGQWMWDEITVPMSASMNTQEMVDRIEKAVQEATEENARIAEQEWKRGARGDSLSRFSPAPVVTMRPSGSDLQVLVRYVTRASERFELRNRLYQLVLDLLREPAPSPKTEPASA
ncbi:MAG: mechanosensitive ion channel domain-containing protein [Terracidiphilus sp.]